MAIFGSKHEQNVITIYEMKRTRLIDGTTLQQAGLYMID